MRPDRNIEIKRIFLAACDLKADERAAYLDGACKGDPDLRFRVDELLALDDGNDLITARSLGGPHTTGRQSTDSEKQLLETRHRKQRPWESAIRAKPALWTILIVVVLAVCVQLRSQFKRHLLHTKAEELAVVLDVTTRHLRMWIKDNLEQAEMLAGDPRTIEAVAILANLDPSKTNELEQLKNSGAHGVLREILSPAMAATSSFYDIMNKEGYELACDSQRIVGMRVRSGWGAQREWRTRGNPLFVPTVRSGAELEGMPKTNATRVVAFSVPIKDQTGRVLAFFGWGSRAASFSEILEAGRFGETGETFAFDNDGMLITESRFTEELKGLGMVNERDGWQSTLVVSLRDPGGDLVSGFQPDGELDERPLTEPALHALAEQRQRDDRGRAAIIDQPYRNYLGRKVIGAWQWIPDYGRPFGVVTEIELTEALRPLRLLDLSVILLLGLSLTVTGISAFVIGKRHQQSRSLVGASGQYTLIRRIGEGGLGEVFLAEHMLMKRPTAIKLLKEHAANSESIKRFEREVTLASQLTHPNTIQIYDYGLTGEGRFYYAMEYLEGLNLGEVIEEEGGPLPVGRVISILLQTCQSLAEAHEMGMVHRDIKPFNIMACKRGGQFDVVKVLDFGLAKKVESHQTSDITAPQQLSGTLLYMAPERIRDPQKVDARTDIYSVGALGYYLLTGESPFPRKTDLDVLYRVVNETPESPSKHSKMDIPTALESLILSCLAKDMDLRPSSSNEVIDKLEKLALAHPWTQHEARDWWEAREQDQDSTRPLG